MAPTDTLTRPNATRQMVRFQVCLDPQLLAVAEQQAATTPDESVSRVIRRWVRAGAAAEGLQGYA